ncbi:MAG TPA: AMP-binding protein [Thermoanaerobaculia bacterium]|nr:AMP-binding protein [Thermoanaerobaculia bacterium]
MYRADSLPAVLFRRAAATPEEPWLFYRRGWDWSWWPWRSVAERVAAWTESLSPLAAGTRAAFAAAPSPSTIALDLALQGAGLLSVPVPPDLTTADLAAALAERRAEVWVNPEGEDLSIHFATERDGRSVREAGGAVVDGGRVFTARDLIGAATTIEELLPGGRRGREILVSCRPLSDPAERQLLAWAIWSGAALLLEPDRSAGVATAVWARPTLFHGTAAEIALLRQAALRRRRWRPKRLPFGRLHTLLVDGEPGELPVGERELWEKRGVRLAAIPVIPVVLPAPAR